MGCNCKQKEPIIQYVEPQPTPQIIDVFIKERPTTPEEQEMIDAFDNTDEFFTKSPDELRDVQLKKWVEENNKNNNNE
jgi:hypothetical protein